MYDRMSVSRSGLAGRTNGKNGCVQREDDMKSIDGGHALMIDLYYDGPT